MTAAPLFNQKGIMVHALCTIAHLRRASPRLAGYWKRLFGQCSRDWRAQNANCCRAKKN